MTMTITRRLALAGMIAAGTITSTAAFADGHALQLRLSTSGSETDARSVAMADVFGPAVSDFAS